MSEVITPLAVGTTFNPADKEAHVTLSGSNLTGTGTPGWTGSVRTIINEATGKYYWEYTGNTLAQSQTGVGMFTAAIAIASVVTSTPRTGTCGLSKGSGTTCSVYTDGNSFITVGGVPGSSIGFGSGWSNGAVFCIAVDLGAQLIWYRIGAAGNWNNSGTANPATGTGGVSIPNLGGANPAYPVASFGGNDQITANFGDSAFTGAVPAGFNAGFPGTAAAGAVQARALIMA